MKRSKDNRQTMYFRTDRFHRTNGYWYFLTREGKNVGPFENKKRAERELEFFLELRNVSVAKG
jgi:hypothetical protein